MESGASEASLGSIPRIRKVKRSTRPSNGNERSGIVAKSSANMMDVVFIRKSTQGQEEAGQIANVEAMLKEAGTSVPKQNWFVGTTSRRKVNANPAFIRLMELVEAGQVGTVYVESQDRWGTANRVELFALLGTLRKQKTRLYDLRAKRDLTGDDFATEITAVMLSFKSEQELKDIAYRSLRTRVNNFKEIGSWPTGTHPFGYGKACYAPDGNLRWIWQPTSRVLGQLFYPDPSEKLIAAGAPNQKIPRKDKADKIILVPSDKPEFVESVKLVFDLFTRVGLSRRQISARLNKENRKFYDHPFTHPLVSQILRNPAYAGDIHFGKTRSGELYTFNDKGVVVPAEKMAVTEQRAVADRIVMENTHEALIDRSTWNVAQSKLKAESGRTSFAPRNPAYFLKQIFVCGHCGKGLTGRTDTDRTTRKRTVFYVCPTYTSGRCNGHPVECGYHRISHSEAEQLLLDKIRDLGLTYDSVASQGARGNLEKRLSDLSRADESSEEQWSDWLLESVNEFAGFITNHYAISDYRTLQRLRKAAVEFHTEDDLSSVSFARLPITLAKFTKVIKTVEADAIEGAKKKIVTLDADHRAYTLAQAKSTDLQRGVLQKEVEAIEAQLQEWKPRTVPISERLNLLYSAEAEREAERQQLLAEWPKLEAREKGEALRRLFSTVTLFWDRTFQPASKNPLRPRKTERAGRYRYCLKRDQIKWSLATSDLAGSW